jgi:hypothetical protein
MKCFLGFAYLFTISVRSQLNTVSSLLGLRGSLLMINLSIFLPRSTDMLPQLSIMRFIINNTWLPLLQLKSRRVALPSYTDLSLSSCGQW